VSPWEGAKGLYFRVIRPFSDLGTLICRAWIAYRPACAFSSSFLSISHSLSSASYSSNPSSFAVWLVILTCSYATMPFAFKNSATSKAKSSSSRSERSEESEMSDSAGDRGDTSSRGLSKSETVFVGDCSDR